MDYRLLYEALLDMEHRANTEKARLESLKQYGRAAAFSALAVGCLKFRREILLTTRTLVARVYV